MLASLWIGGMLPILDQIVSSGKADFIPARNLFTQTKLSKVEPIGGKYFKHF